MARRSTEERFWSKVDKSDSSGCWPWLAGTNGEKGYGHFRLNDGHVLAHRLAWLLAFGSDPGGSCVLHRCDNPKCVRPDHLFLGTVQDNNQDKKKKGRGGHSLTVQDVIAIRARSAEGESGYRLAKDFSVCQSTISRIVRRIYWSDVEPEVCCG